MDDDDNEERKHEAPGQSRMMGGKMGQQLQNITKTVGMQGQRPGRQIQNF